MQKSDAGSPPRLAHRTALVTGAARGIGEATARLFAQHGARVLITDLNEPGARAIADSINAASPAATHAAAMKLDVRIESDWQRAIAHAQQLFGPLDILVNNAAITGFGPADPPTGPHDPEHVSLEAWRAVHATNLDGVFLGCKHAIAAMKQRDPALPAASIVNMSSRSGQVGIPGAAAYASSKAAVRNHTKTVALYCAEQGYRIRCNSIHPGSILTPMWDPVLGEGEARAAAIAEFSREVPLGRMGSTLDVAHMALFLASDESAYVTGAEFVIDGGLLAGTAATPRR
ncbi:MAG: SDR family oxidoreductase [Phycisphaeraceae bacterium]|nr:SDR family oxidoreductase [Phycisphaeraceae bacterium]